MAQIASAVGREPARVDRRFREIVVAMTAALGTGPSDRRSSSLAHAAKFRPVRPGGSRVVDGPDGSWIAGIGTWFFDGRDGQDDLTRLLELMRTGAPLDRSTLDRLDGSFAIVAWLPQRRELLAITDRIGTVHLYRAAIEHGWLLCSSSLALQAVRGAAWDPDGVREFVATGTIFGDGTLFEGVTKLQPARVYRFTADGTCSSETYWRFDQVAWNRGPIEGTPETLAEALVDTLQRIVRRFRSPVLDLTGGYDSRAVLAAMTRIDHPFATVVNGPRDHPDVVVADRIAREFRLDHRHQPAPHDWGVRWWGRAVEALPLCDGEYDILEYARTMEHHLAIAREFDVSINGSGGEFCKGYWWELLEPRVGQQSVLDVDRVARARFATDDWADTVLAGAPATALPARIAAAMDAAIGSIHDLPNTAQLDYVYLALRMQRWQGRIASSTSRIWPCISPFLFRLPLEHAVSAPPRTRRRNRMSARVIEHLNPRLAAIPLAQGYPAESVRLGNLHRFAPLVIDLGRRAWGKALRIVTRSPYAGDVRSEGLSGLLAQSEVQDRLRWSRMVTAELFDRGGLERWIEGTLRRPTAVELSRLGRILTLEQLGRTVRALSGSGS